MGRISSCTSCSSLYPYEKIFSWPSPRDISKVKGMFGRSLYSSTSSGASSFQCSDELKMRQVDIRTIKTILDALREEYESGNSYPATATEASPKSPLRVFQKMQLCLSPLFFIETNLLKILAPGSSDSRDMVVRAGHGWKEILRAKNDSFVANSERETRAGQPRSKTLISLEYDPTSILVAQRHDIIALWDNPGVQEILTRRRPQVRESPGL